MRSAASQTTEAASGLRRRVLDALATVYDPELDEPITTLRFISSCHVSADGDVEVLLRLPTPQCAPNFAFLMAADARSAVRRLPGVRTVEVQLEDHYTGDEINAALRREEGFTGAFPGETDDDELHALRELFTRKALIARQSRLCETIVADGGSPEQLLKGSVADLPDTPEARRCLELRNQLGIDAAPGAPALVLASGEPLTVDQLQRWLRMARLVRTSLDVNGGICRSLLQARHGLAPDPQEVPR
jgi:metal-sulfur cluster biosynthetic enzyme